MTFQKEYSFYPHILKEMSRNAQDYFIKHERTRLMDLMEWRALNKNSTCVTEIKYAENVMWLKECGFKVDFTNEKCTCNCLHQAYSISW